MRDQQDSACEFFQCCQRKCAAHCCAEIFENLDIEYRNNGLFKAVKQDLHYGIVCKSCLSTPISGKCYKCTSCPEFYLCQACFNTDFHKEHNFLYREVWKIIV